MCIFYCQNEYSEKQLPSWILDSNLNVYRPTSRGFTIYTEYDTLYTSITEWTRQNFPQKAPFITEKKERIPRKSINIAWKIKKPPLQFSPSISAEAPLLPAPRYNMLTQIHNIVILTLITIVHSIGLLGVLMEVRPPARSGGVLEDSLL